jgi:hypothetical protein
MGERTWWGAIGRAVLTVLLVTAVVAAAVGGAAYVASRALVGLLS